jgi:hypothetical protein
LASSYDPKKMIDEAQRWREKAAATSDCVYRDECLHFAAQCEWLVKRSIETPPVKENLINGLYVL